MDYLLAAHIQVTGGAEAGATFNQLAVQINNFGKAAATANTGGLASGMETATKSAGLLERTIGQVGIALTRMATYQGIGLVIGGISSAVKGVLDFDDAMVQSLAIQEGVTGKMRGAMEDLAETIAVRLGEAPADVAKGFYYLASAGLNVEQQMAALPAVANFAKAGMMDLNKATEMLYDSLTALGLKVADPQEQLRNLTMLSDLLTVAAIKSQGSVQNFGVALANKAGADIRTYGIDLKDGIALLEVFADRGIKGAKAGTAFDQIIRDMAIKATTNADAFSKMNIEVFDSKGNYNDLGTILSQLDAALGGLPIEQRTAALKELGFTLRGGQIIQSLLGVTDVFYGFRDGLNAAGGAAERVALNQMESLRAKMDQMKAMTMVFAIEGFEDLQRAGAWLLETFAPAINEIIDILGHLVNGMKPVAAAFAGLVAVAVTKGLEAIAAAMSLVFGVISQHPGVIEGIGAALAGLAAAQVVSAIAGIARALGETLYLKALMVQDAINGLIIKIMTIAQTEGALAAVKFGLSGIVTALTSPVAIGAGIGLAILALYKGMQDAKDKADEFRRGLEQQYDTQSILGMNLALDRTVERMDAVTNKSKGNFFATIFDVFDILAAEAATRKANDELANMTIGIELLANMATGASLPIGAWSQALENAGMHLKDMPIDDTRTKFQEMGVSMTAAGANTKQVGDLLEELAKQAGIDIRLPMDDWAPKLADVWVKFTSVRDITSEMGGVAEGSASGMSSMEKAIMTLRDEAATAEDKLKALKDVMEGLSGGKQNLFDMETAFSSAMEGMRVALEKNGTSFSSFTEAGRANRDMLSDASDKARDYALAQAEASGDIQVGITSLQQYSDAIAGSMRNAGMAEPEIQKLLTAMGLTPKQIETLFKITQPPGEPEATKEGLNDAANPGGDPRKALIAPETVTQAQVQTQDDLAQLASAQTVSYEPFPAVAPMANTEDALTTTARSRTSPAVQEPENHPTVEREFNNSARSRWSPATQQPDGHGTTNFWFDWSTGARWSKATQYAETGGAETALNNTARDRWTTVHVQYTTSGAAFNDAFSVGESSAKGNIFMHAYANGGFENHIAQIAKPGLRMWAEPETGGEAYIPLAGNKRDRSLAIWEQTGRILGAKQSTSIDVTAPVTVNVTGSDDPEATGRAVAALTGEAIHGVMRRVLVEMQTA